MMRPVATVAVLAGALWLTASGCADDARVLYQRPAANTSGQTSTSGSYGGAAHGGTGVAPPSTGGYPPDPGVCIESREPCICDPGLDCTCPPASEPQPMLPCYRSCPTGLCTMDCHAQGFCELDCASDCSIFCHPGSMCLVLCGAGCVVNCLEGALCEVHSLRGASDVYCHEDATCICSSGPCNCYGPSCMNP
jgi:hypothetical protein